MSSIFDRIFRYRQREKRTPREDYFTEIFVAVIEKYDELRIALAAWLSGVEGIRSVRIETQREFTVVDSCKPRRPDVWMEAKDAQDASHWIIVENKIDSGEGENQLADYAKILEARSGLKSKTLVYITKYTSETDSCSRDGVKFKHLRWPKVYDFVQKHNDHLELAVELLRLMGVPARPVLRPARKGVGMMTGNKFPVFYTESRGINRNWLMPERGKMLARGCA